MLDNHESPAAPAEHYDTLATLPPNTSKLDAMDLLIRKITQLKDLCNTCSNGDDAIHGVFWFMADTLQCCDSLATEVFKAVAAAGRTAPAETGTAPGRYIALPENAYNDLSLSLESLSAQQLIASDTEFYQTNTLETISKFMLGMHRETERAQQLLSTGSALRSAGDE